MFLTQVVYFMVYLEPVLTDFFFVLFSQWSLKSFLINMIRSDTASVTSCDCGYFKDYNVSSNLARIGAKNVVVVFRLAKPLKWRFKIKCLVLNIFFNSSS